MPPGRTTAVRSDVAPGWRLVDAAAAVHRRLSIPALRPALPYLLMLPALAVVSVLAVGIVDLLWRSLHSFDPFLHREGPLSLEQYRRLLVGTESSYYLGVLLRTLAISSAVTVFAVGLALPVAYFILRVSKRSWRLIALNLVLIPFLMGEIVRAFGWLLLLGRRGALAWVLSLFDVREVSLVGTRLGIWIGMMQVMLPIATLVLLPGMRRVDPDLEKAAATLGARPVRVWIHVVLPLVRSALVAAALVVFSLSMTEFAIPQVLGLGRQPFVANAIYNIYFLQNNLHLGSAFAILLLGIVTLTVVVVSRLTQSKSERR